MGRWNSFAIPVMIAALFPSWTAQSLPELGLAGLILLVGLHRNHPRATNSIVLLLLAYLYVLHWIPLSILGDRSPPLALLVWGGVAGYAALASYVVLAGAWRLRALAIPYRWSLPLLWILGEEASVQLLFGTDWLSVGYSVVESANYRVLYGLIGVRGVSGVLMLIVGLAVDTYFHSCEAWTKARRLLVLAACFSWSLHGSLDAKQVPPAPTSRLAVGVVELGPHPEGWTSDVQQAANRGAQLIVGPEGALTDPIKIIALGAPVIVGAYLRCTPPPHSRHTCFENLALHFDAQGQLKEHYSKQKLVPLYENAWLGLESVGRRQMVAGTAPGRFTLPTQKLQIGTLICYEISDPGLMRDLVKERTIGIIFHPTNDDWDRSAVAVRQHVMIMRAASAEFGLTIIRSSQGGPSLVSDPRGILLPPLTEASTQNLRWHEVAFAPPSTFRGRWPRLAWLLVIYGALGGLLVLVGRAWLKSRS